MHHISGFVEFYISPFIFGIGLIFLFSGIVNYYIIGVNFEEDRREKGRQSLLWASLLFLIGLLIFSISHWLYSLSLQVQQEVDTEVEERGELLPVPNVPGYNG